MLYECYRAPLKLNIPGQIPTKTVAGKHREDNLPCLQVPIRTVLTSARKNILIDLRETTLTPYSVFYMVLGTPLKSVRSSRTIGLNINTIRLVL